MAPQNSTLLHEDTELSNELSHYSPIPKEPYCIEICINNTYTDEIIRPGKSTLKYDRVIYEQVQTNYNRITTLFTMYCALGFTMYDEGKIESIVRNNCFRLTIFTSFSFFVSSLLLVALNMRSNFLNF